MLVREGICRDDRQKISAPRFKVPRDFVTLSKKKQEPYQWDQKLRRYDCSIRRRKCEDKKHGKYPFIPYPDFHPNKWEESKLQHREAKSGQSRNSFSLCDLQEKRGKDNDTGAQRTNDVLSCSYIAADAKDLPLPIRLSTGFHVRPPPLFALFRGRVVEQNAARGEEEMNNNGTARQRAHDQPYFVHPKYKAEQSNLPVAREIFHKECPAPTPQGFAASIFDLSVLPTSSSSSHARPVSASHVGSRHVPNVIVARPPSAPPAFCFATHLHQVSSSSLLFQRKHGKITGDVSSPSDLRNCTTLSWEDRTSAISIPTSKLLENAPLTSLQQQRTSSQQIKWNERIGETIEARGLNDCAARTTVVVSAIRIKTKRATEYQPQGPQCCDEKKTEKEEVGEGRERRPILRLRITENNEDEESENGAEEVIHDKEGEEGEQEEEGGYEAGRSHLSTRHTLAPPAFSFSHKNNRGTTWLRTSTSAVPLVSVSQHKDEEEPLCPSLWKPPPPNPTRAQYVRDLALRMSIGHNHVDISPVKRREGAGEGECSGEHEDGEEREAEAQGTRIKGESADEVLGFDVQDMDDMGAEWYSYVTARSVLPLLASNPVPLLPPGPLSVDEPYSYCSQPRASSSTPSLLSPVSFSLFTLYGPCVSPRDPADSCFSSSSSSAVSTSSSSSLFAAHSSSSSSPFFPVTTSSSYPSSNPMALHSLLADTLTPFASELTPYAFQLQEEETSLLNRSLALSLFTQQLQAERALGTNNVEGMVMDQSRWKQEEYYSQILHLHTRKNELEIEKKQKQQDCSRDWVRHDQLERFMQCVVFCQRFVRGRIARRRFLRYNEECKREQKRQVLRRIVLIQALVRGRAARKRWLKKIFVLRRKRELQKHLGEVRKVVYSYTGSQHLTRRVMQQYVVDRRQIFALSFGFDSYRDYYTVADKEEESDEDRTEYYKGDEEEVARIAGELRRQEEEVEVVQLPFSVLDDWKGHAFSGVQEGRSGFRHSPRKRGHARCTSIDTEKQVWHNVMGGHYSCKDAEEQLDQRAPRKTNFSKSMLQTPKMQAMDGLAREAHLWEMAQAAKEKNKSLKEHLYSAAANTTR